MCGEVRERKSREREGRSEGHVITGMEGGSKGEKRKREMGG